MLTEIVAKKEVEWERVCALINGERGEVDPSVLTNAIRKNAPLDVIRVLVPKFKKRSLRVAFVHSCRHKSSSNEVRSYIMDQINPSPSLAETMLLDAIKAGCDDAVDLILERDLFLTSRFYSLTFKNDDDFEKLAIIICTNKLINKDLFYNVNILHGAAYRGHLRLAKFIFNRYPGTLSIGDREKGNFPIHCAFEVEELEMAELLLSKGLQESVDKSGGLLALNKRWLTPLQIACKGADSQSIEKIVSMLERVDSSLLHDTRSINTMVHCVARHGVKSSIKKILKYCPQAISMKDQMNMNPIAISLQYNQKDVTRIIYEELKSTKRKEYISTYLRETISSLVQQPHVDPGPIVEYIIEHDVKYHWLQELTLIHKIVKHGNIAHLQSFVLHCLACLSTKDYEGKLPIYYACELQLMDSIDFLLKVNSERSSDCMEYGGLLEQCQTQTHMNPIRLLLHSFSTVDDDESFLHVSQCIAACLKRVKDLPLVHEAFHMKLESIEHIIDIMEIFTSNPICTWGETSTVSLFSAIDYIVEVALDDASVEQILGIYISNAAYRQCASIQNTSHQLPLHYAIERRVRWQACRQLIDANYYALSEPDGKTGLRPFMQAAVGFNCCSLATIFEVLRSNPDALYRYCM